MEEINIRWQLRFEKFVYALKTMEDVLPRYNEMNELEKDGLIQRFEFTFDIAWKVMQDYLKSAGYIDKKGPRLVLEQMAQDGFIDPFIWADILIARNDFSHTYNHALSRSHLDKIVYDFVPAFIEFKTTMQKLI
ncbi:MAG: HI0074 family nucleotidyltransferase substrate-binding subunit [Bacteroidota bacterium]